MNNEITIDGVVYVEKEPTHVGVYGTAVTPEEPKPWPQVGDKCFCLSDHGGVFVTLYAPTYQSDVDRLSMGSYFKTVEEAERVKAERIAITTIKNYAREKWGEFKPDWGDSDQIKFNIVKMEDERSYGPDYNYTRNICPKLGHFAEKAHCEEIADKFPKELDIIFKT